MTNLLRAFHPAAKLLLALLALPAGGAATAAAPEFPTRPLRYIVPFPPGGSTDLMARIVAHALTERLGEQVVIDNRGGAGGTVGAGKIRMLAVTSLTRVPDLPDVQTVAESFPGFEVISWQGLCTPAGVPKAALARLRNELAAVLALPETRKRLAEQSIQPGTLTTDQFAKFIRSERDKFAKAVKDAGIKPQ